MQRTFLVSLIFGLALTTPSVFAATDSEDIHAEPAGQPVVQPELQWKKRFEILDANKDGMIDSKEAKADKGLNKQFKTIAKKGKIDQSGYMKWQKAQQPRS